MFPGIMYSMSALGPALGFFMGAVFLSLYVDPKEKPAGLTDKHPAWVGAWWLGFIVCAVLSLFVALPLMMFPKHLPIISKEDHTERPPAMSFGTSLRGKQSESSTLHSL